ncbi:MAG TPA: phosphate acyltransferase PlsX [Chlamydiales bacterium]|jgi:glycerol-3-phosphate acyltransferase PlsX|nr:phosphate acyltransferase PlsX [Chlamydiales bacterium]
MKIGIDLMGNDNSPETLLAALQELDLDSSVKLAVFGLPEYKELSPFEYVKTAEFISMDDHPLNALRRKKEASLCIGLRALKAKKIDAFVSAGNTGALVTGAKIILGNLPGILRPALLARMPTKKEPVAVLDVGANVQVKACHLVQFALLGAAFARSQGIEWPRVGLLNIGSEAIKGTSELRTAYQELKTLDPAPFHFAGNIEGKSVFDGDVDVLITDGFTGNVFLKTAEGIASLILDRFGALLPPEEYKKLAPRIRDFSAHLHYAEYPGAILAGVQGIVIKCHGYSTSRAFLNAVKGAVQLVRGHFIDRIDREIIR